MSLILSLHNDPDATHGTCHELLTPNCGKCIPAWDDQIFILAKLADTAEEHTARVPVNADVAALEPELPSSILLDCDPDFWELSNVSVSAESVSFERFGDAQLFGEGVQLLGGSLDFLNSL